MLAALALGIPHESELAVQPEPIAPTTLRQWPSNVPPSIVFNLPRCSQRWAKLQLSLANAGIPYSRLENVADAHHGGVEARECRLFDNMECFPSYFTECQNCSKGIVGCAVTHFRGWNHSLLKHTEAPWQAFSEDDVEFEVNGAQGLLSTVEAVAQRNPNWNVIFFAPTAAEYNLVGLRQWDGQNDFENWINACRYSSAWTSFYVLSQRARNFAVEQMGTSGFAYPLDITVFKLCGKGDCFSQFGGVVGHTISLDDKKKEGANHGQIVAPQSLTMNSSAEC